MRDGSTPIGQSDGIEDFKDSVPREPSLLLHTALL